MMMFRVLGPVEAVADSRTAQFKGRMQRSLMLLLLVNRGNLVQIESLIGELWPGVPPSGVVNALQAHVSRLRRRLEALEPAKPQLRLRNDAIGYRLMVDDDELDAAVFEQGIGRMRLEALSDPEGAGVELRRLLGLWRGPVFGGSTTSPVVQAVAARYEESRIAGYELLFDCELASRRHNYVVPELYQLVAQHPFKERFHQQLMTALYRAGRQNDALEVYQGLRRRLADDLGLEPSPTMRAFEEAVLNHDDVLWEDRTTDPRESRRMVQTGARPVS